MIIELQCVKRDGTATVGTVQPLYPYVQPFTLPRAEDATLKLKFVRPNRQAADITGATITFALRKNSDDPLPLVSRQATSIVGPSGTAEVVLVPGDTIELDEKGHYVYDVQLIDVTGKRWQVVPESQIEIGPIISRPDDPVTVPAASSAVLPWLSFGHALELETDGTDEEQVLAEFAVNFDDITGSLPNLAARMSALVWVSGGVAILRVRHGGTPGEPDGTLLLEADAVSTETLLTVTDTATKPSGLRMVKVTAENDTDGESVLVRALTFAGRGAV